jgi:YidC/Oxa1 family membrane protein insertase
MEGQGKRLLLACGLALAFMLGWQMLFGKKQEPQPADGSAGSGSAVAPKPVPVAPPTMGGGPVAPSDPSSDPSSAPSMTPEATRGPEQTIVLSYPGRFAATFSSYGGALTGWKLADPRFERDATHGELLPGKPDTGAFFVYFRSDARTKSDHDIPRRTEWQGTKVDDTTVRYTLSTPVLDVEKTFTVFPDAYVVKATIKVTAKVPEGKQAHQSLAVTAFAYQDPNADHEPSSQSEARVLVSSTLRKDEIVHTTIKKVIESPRFEPNITWTGFEHPYLLAAYAPKRNLETEQIEKHTYAGSGATEGLMWTEIVFPPQAFASGTSAMTWEVVGFLGPKNYTELERADAAAGFSTGFTHTIDFGWFAVIGKPLLWLLQKFYSVVGNWGIAIIMLTFLVKMATLYWTTKSMRSMKAMASLAPQAKLLQEKYKDDRQRLQAETMALYKQHNVNPVAGCLPILLQMPIWLALYRMLSSAGELYQAPFIPGWIDDLTGRDPFHILPVVLVVTMFVQARLQPATVDSMQQKFLQYGMPLMFGVMSFFFPSGLTIYIFTNTVLSALHSIYMNKFDKKSIALSEQMKKNQAATAAKPTVPTATAKKPAKPVIDVESAEVASAAADDGDDSEAEAPSGGATPSNPARARKRKKRRR